VSEYSVVGRCSIARIIVGHKEIVELLLQCGADVHFKHRWQLTPLIRAVTNGHASVRLHCGGGVARCLARCLCSPKALLLLVTGCRNIVGVECRP